MNYKTLVILAISASWNITACNQATPESTQPIVLKNLPQLKTTNTMDKTEFWRIIDFAHRQAQGDDRIQEALLIKTLEQHSPDEIVEFECLLCQNILDADDFKVMAAQKIIEGYVSDDSYLYYRCWLIGQGEKTFREALQNPDSLASVVTEETVVDFESMLYVSTEAYRNKTGKQTEDETFPREIAYARGLDYDGATQTKGEDWTPEQLPTLLPKLWAKYN